MLFKSLTDVRSDKSPDRRTVFPNVDRIWVLSDLPLSQVLGAY